MEKEEKEEKSDQTCLLVLLANGAKYKYKYKRTSSSACFPDDETEAVDAGWSEENTRQSRS